MSVKRKKMQKRHVSSEKYFKKISADVSTWKFISAVLAVLLVVSVFTGGFNMKAGSAFSGISNKLGSASESKMKDVITSPKVADGAVKLEFYVMSQCPYGTQVEDAIAPVLEKLGENVDFRLDFISTDLGDGEFKSLHGQPETDGNIVQLCAIKYNPESYMDMIVCQNKDARSIPGNWEKCAKDNGLDVESIRTCYEGDEGKELLSESVKRAQDRQASGSPTIYLNDVPYSGGRSEADFMRAICNEFSGERPQACSEIPEPVKIDAFIVNDKRCATCDPTQITGAIKRLFPGAQIKNVDVNDAQGKELVEELGLEVVPAFVLGNNLAETEAVKQNAALMGAFDQVGDYYKIKDSETGASYYIDEEKRAQKLESMGITLGDNRPQVDFFVMSYCPFGNQAEEALVDVYAELKDEVDFIPRYVYYENYGGGGPSYCIDSDNKLCSMHGVQEANQNIRELCVRDLEGMQAWFDFSIAMNSACSSSNADTCWEATAQELGYDVEAIRSCEAEKAEEYATEDLELSKMFGATGSPAVYVDGEKFNGARTPAGYLAAICNAFDEKPAACDNVELSNEQAAAPQGTC
jgi:hypothetical protein